MISVRAASKTFYSNPVLREITFDVERDKCLVVLGQSGTGKSVLLKLLSGLLTPDNGSVTLQTRNIGMLFQKNALFDSFNVFENLDFTLRERTNLDKISRAKKVTRFLEWVGLSKTESLMPDELSGGMQKRLGIARALIVEPEIIFYDEPTAGLDPITSRMIAELILRLKNEMKTTVVVVTSDVLRSFQLADSIGLLVRTPTGSELKIAGSPEQTRQSKDPMIEQFISGNTKGPLTSQLEDDGRQKRNHDTFARNISEKLDVDFF